VLFFHGALVHGSGPNTSSDRYRRAFIGHYATPGAQLIGSWYADAVTFDGEDLRMATNEHNQMCGEFRERPDGLDWTEHDMATVRAERAH
jgi:hypothetical protein